MELFDSIAPKLLKFAWLLNCYLYFSNTPLKVYPSKGCIKLLKI